MPYSIDPYEREAEHASLEMRARSAMIGAQLPHVGAGDRYALAQTQYTENNARAAMGGAAADTRAAAAAAMHAGAVGPGGIDVNSYSGSIYAGNASPIPGYRRQESSSEAADRILRGRFGAPPNERGAVDIVGAMGTRSVVAPYMVSDARRTMAGGTYSAPNPADAAAVMQAGSGGTGDYLAPPATVTQLLRDSRAPLIASLQNRQSMLDNRESQIAAREAMTATRDAKLAQEDVNKRALLQAMQPVGVPGAVRERTPAEGLYFRRDSTIATPATTREPTVAEAMRGYLGAGGAPSPQADAILKAMGAAQPFAAHEETLPSGAKIIYNTPRSAIPNPQQARPARPLAAKPEPKAGIEEVKIGPQTYFYHHESKRYFNAAGQPVVFPTGGSQLPPAMQEAANAAKPKAAAPAVDYKTADDVRTAYQSKALSREQAENILRGKFGHK